MQIVLHIGAHATDENRLIGCLETNRDLLWQKGICIPPPKTYRNHLREALRLGDKVRETPFGREAFLKLVGTNPEDSRLILSGQNVLGVADRIFHHNTLYGLLESRISRVEAIFPTDDVEIFVGLRNPATFIPAAFAMSAQDDISSFLGQTDIYALRWSQFIARLQAIVPAARITTWCNEDLPLIFGQVARAMADVTLKDPLQNSDQILQDVLSEEGLSHYRSYTQAHPPPSDRLEQRIIAAFADKFELEDVEEEIDLPGWSSRIVDDLTDIYDDDFERLTAMDGIRFITPAPHV